VLDNGALLDTLVGNRFLVIGQALVLDSVSDETRQAWQQAKVVILPASSQALQGWLDQHGVAAVMLRPDRYIMGLARSAAELDVVTASLPAAQASVA
jgi:3-(3-hydroxy-phenyl)propionate hydroxylase